MTLAEFITRLRPLARPAHDWIILGDATICVRDVLNGDPINLVAQSISPHFDQSWWRHDDADTMARQILRMSPKDFDRLVNAVSGQCTRRNQLRKNILSALHMRGET
jgi:hypothetical protein